MAVAIITLCFVLVVLIFVYVRRVYSFWTRLGVKQLRPIFPIGNLMPLLKQEKCTGDYYVELYEQTKHERFVGIYNLLKPTLLVNDKELAKNILIRDFQYFPDHGTYLNEKEDPLSGHLFSMQGERWKQLRHKLTAAFSSGRIKGMFPKISSRAENLREFVEKSNQIEAYELMARYTTDFIAWAVFGCDIDCINDPSNNFRQVGLQMFEMSFLNKFRLAGNFLFPKLMVMLKIRLMRKHIEEFFFDVVRQNLEYREKHATNQRDFLQLLIQLRNNGMAENDDNWELKTSEGKNFSVNEVAAQLVMFFLAGYETSSTTMSFCLYELARNPEAQRKVQAELDAVYAGGFTYESLQEMHYLDHCIDETLRLYPPLMMLARECVKSYQIPDSNVVIPPGTMIMIPIIGLQRDANNFPDPMKFMPERFTDPMQHDAIKSAYYPFGQGPRVCIGQRLAKVVMKIGLANLLIKSNYEVIDSGPLEFSKKSFLLAPKNGFQLRVSRR